MPSAEPEFKKVAHVLWGPRARQQFKRFDLGLFGARFAGEPGSFSLEHITQNVQDTNTEGWWFTRPACCINGSLPCHFDTWTSGGSNFPRNSKLVHSCVICLVSCTSVLAITFKKTVQSSIHSWSDMADICLNMLEHFRMMGPGWKVKKLKAPIRITVHHPWQHQEHGGNAQVQVCLFHRLGNK